MASEKDGSKIFIDYLGLASNLYNLMLDKLIVGMIATSPNRAYLASRLRHSAQILLCMTSDTLKTLSEMRLMKR